MLGVHPAVSQLLPRSRSLAGLMSCVEEIGFICRGSPGLLAGVAPAFPPF